MIKRRWLIVCCAAALASSAQTAWAGVEAEVGLVAGYFDYQERSSSGGRLNTEQGMLPGVSLELSQPFGEHGWIALSGDWYSGEVQYDGQTQAGRSLHTQTDTRLLVTDLTIAGPGLEAYGMTISPLARAGYRQWQRDILPTSFSTGLEERYRWYELGVGVSACKGLVNSSAGRWCGELWALHGADGRVEVNLREIDAGQPELRLGSRPGGRMRLSGQLGSVTVRLFAHFWKFGSSGEQAVDRPGGRLLVEEPASRSWLAGLGLGVRF
ncbi:MAG: hypothetical protein HLX50_01570 [Alteromonadaceae bacterium]|nr:hypothetical protein [Alteromonadaceae bacterium]